MDNEDLDRISRSPSDLETELSEVADVGHETLHPGIVLIDVTPRNPDALAMSWIYLGGEIV